MPRPPSEEHPPRFDEQTSGEDPAGPGADKREALRRIREQLRVQDERVDEASRDSGGNPDRPPDDEAGD